MLKKIDKNENRLARHSRVRKKVSGTSSCPRLSVYRSTNEIYAQVIDDTNGTTLASASSLEKEVANKVEGKTKTEVAKYVGQIVAERALKKNVKAVVFDRGGYLYTGRVAALAEGAREAGLEF